MDMHDSRAPALIQAPASGLRFLFYLVRELRPKQWTKNAVVFAALLFSFKMATMAMLLRSLAGFFLFCAVSGCVYILNDVADRENDRVHPEKRHRPIAAGLIRPYTALAIGAVLLAGSLVFAWVLKPEFALLLAGYFLLNVAYSFRLKHVVIADVMVIAFGFVLRAVGGALVIGVVLTPWFLICTLLLALFLAISKRRHELYLLRHAGGSHRRVLDSYSMELLNQLNAIVTTATIMSYSLFTFTSGRTVQLMWTIPFVIYGIFRYMYLIHREGKGGRPEQVLLEDRHIRFTVLGYTAAVLLILKYCE